VVISQLRESRTIAGIVGGLDDLRRTAGMRWSFCSVATTSGVLNARRLRSPETAVPMSGAVLF
jgi:hypothetical protein